MVAVVAVSDAGDSVRRARVCVRNRTSGVLVRGWRSAEVVWTEISEVR